jgi:hypothetical protein
VLLGGGGCVLPHLQPKQNQRYTLHATSATTTHSCVARQPRKPRKRRGGWRLAGQATAPRALALAAARAVATSKAAPATRSAPGSGAIEQRRPWLPLSQSLGSLPQHASQVRVDILLFPNPDCLDIRKENRTFTFLCGVNGWLCRGRMDRPPKGVGSGFSCRIGCLPCLYLTTSAHIKT